MIPSSIPFTLFYFTNSARRVSPGFLSICFILLFAGISHGDVIKKNIGGGYIVDDLKGVSGNVEVIYSRPGQKYFYGVGGYKGVLIRVAGRGLILFEYLGGTGYPSRTIISYNTYTKIDNMILEILMKILKPILNPLMDKKINKFIRETQKLANEITVHPEKVYQAIKESGFVEEVELEEFRKLVF